MMIAQVIKLRAERRGRDSVRESERGEQGRRFRDVSLESSARYRFIVVDELGRSCNVLITPTDEIVAAVERDTTALTQFVLHTQRSVVTVERVADDIDL